MAGFCCFAQGNACLAARDSMPYSRWCSRRRARRMTGRSCMTSAALRAKERRVFDDGARANSESPPLDAAFLNAASRRRALTLSQNAPVGAKRYGSVGSNRLVGTMENLKGWLSVLRRFTPVGSKYTRAMHQSNGHRDNSSLTLPICARMSRDGQLGIRSAQDGYRGWCATTSEGSSRAIHLRAL